ncbi:alpha-L-rhamnosidase C-terminal domain-containing protein [Prolixibacter sp. SD074]|uniref:alpha-L-rhamnosidase C-terminal domain-containing protein n=1 Tax=Prolixibacter sp. SD074 TaxID=2652391 RepID=UPI00188E11AA
MVSLKWTSCGKSFYHKRKLPDWGIGAIGTWLYKGQSEIYPAPRQSGFKPIILQPYFSDEPGSVALSHQFRRGQIVSSWEKEKMNVSCNRRKRIIVGDANVLCYRYSFCHDS